MSSVITDKNIEEIQEGQVRTFMVSNDIPLDITGSLEINSVFHRRNICLICL